MEADSPSVHSPPEICVFFTQNNLQHLSFAEDNFQPKIIHFNLIFKGRLNEKLSPCPKLQYKTMKG